MSDSDPAEYAKELLGEAAREMRKRSIDPDSDHAWMDLALQVLQEFRLMYGETHPENDELVVMDKETHQHLHKITDTTRGLIHDLKLVEQEYLSIESPKQRDVLVHAMTALIAIDRRLDPIRISQMGGLPTPLRLVLADVVNAIEKRFGRLVSPPDKVILAARGVTDSPSDRIRLTVQAYSAAVIDHLITRHSWRGQNAYKAVAKTLSDAGFHPPGRPERAVTESSVRDWYERTMGPTCKYLDEFGQAKAALEAVRDPGDLLDVHAECVRALQFSRS